jgi:hypothetical protein
MRTYRTFDKLIATIRTRRSAGSLRSPFGAVKARCTGQNDSSGAAFSTALQEIG